MFKNVLKKQNLMITVLALALIFCFSFGVSAAPLYSNNDISYLVGDSADYETTGNVSVTINVQSKQVNGTALNKSDVVTFVGDGETSKAYTVRDVLEAWAAKNSVTLTTTKYNANLGYSEEIDYVNGSSTYIFAMIKGEDRYSPADPAFYYDGWKFRVNTQIPQLSAGWGATMADTYVKSGDVVDFYYDNPTSANNAAKFTRIYDISVADGTLTATIQQSNDWFMTESPWTAHMNNFAAYQNVKVIVSDGTTAQILTTDANGQVSVTGATAGKTYTIRVLPTFDTNGYIEYTGIFSKTYTVQ